MKGDYITLQLTHQAAHKKYNHTRTPPQTTRKPLLLHWSGIKRHLGRYGADDGWECCVHGVDCPAAGVAQQRSHGGQQRLAGIQRAPQLLRVSGVAEVVPEQLSPFSKRLKQRSATHAHASQQIRCTVRVPG